MHTTPQRPRVAGAARDEGGWADVVVLLVFAAVIGFAFVWALVLHEKPLDEPRRSTPRATTVTLTPPTLPAPRKYKVEGGVNVRQGAGTNTTVITKLDHGASVTVECRVTGQDVSGPDGSSNQWLRITLPEGVGYVSALYVRVGNDLEDRTRIGVCP